MFVSSRRKSTGSFSVLQLLSTLHFGHSQVFSGWSLRSMCSSYLMHTQGNSLCNEGRSFFGIQVSPVPARHFRMLTLFLHFLITISIWPLNLRPLYTVTLRNLSFLTVSICWPSASRCGFHEILRTFDENYHSLSFVCINLHLSFFSPRQNFVNLMLHQDPGVVFNFPPCTHVAVSSANKLVHVSASRSTSMSLIKMKNGSGEIEEPCGRPSSGLTLVLLVPFTSTYVFLPLKKCLSYLVNLQGMFMFCIWCRSPSRQTLSYALA